MLALSPSTFPNFLWPLEEPTEQFYFPTEITQTPTYSTTPLSSIPDYVSPQQPETLHQSATSVCYPNTIKKLNHNASERHRRKMMNNLYSSLRSLLPASDHMKKLSIPGTISRVLEYIPELQEQIKKLSERKETIRSKIYKDNHNQLMNRQTKFTDNASGVPVVSATKLTETEVVIEIRTAQKFSLSEMLLVLEEEGLSLLNCSLFESFEGWLFYTLHLQTLQVEGAYRLDCHCQALTKKLASLFQNISAN